MGYRFLVFSAMGAVFFSACAPAAEPPPVATEPLTAAAEQVSADSLPPAPVIDYDTSQWTEVIRLDSSLLLDLKYATTDNFVGQQLYPCGRCFLRSEVAQALVRAQRQVQAQGYGLLLLDCYRPRPVQWALWSTTPDPRYVTDPRKGSMHNRGVAVDLTLVDRQQQPLDMGTPYDFFGPAAYPAYTDLPDTILQRRALLQQVMRQAGFQPIRTEWWHYYFSGGSRWSLSDMEWPCPGQQDSLSARFQKQ